MFLIAADLVPTLRDETTLRHRQGDVAKLTREARGALFSWAWLANDLFKHCDSSYRTRSPVMLSTLL